MPATLKSTKGIFGGVTSIYSVQGVSDCLSETKGKKKIAKSKKIKKLSKIKEGAKDPCLHLPLKCILYHREKKKLSLLQVLSDQIKDS